jgi:hypothetical protein
MYFQLLLNSVKVMKDLSFLNMEAMAHPSHTELFKKVFIYLLVYIKQQLPA